MDLYDRILVPTDGSEGVERAVRHALDLAAAHDATVHALYVVNTASFGGLPTETSWETIDEMLRSDAEEAVETVRRLGDERGVRVETSVVNGAPNAEIVRYAEREGCDLVVMGTHGRGGIDRLLLGSVAEKVVRASNVPVLTVRVGESEPGDGETPPESRAAGADGPGDGEASEDASSSRKPSASGDGEERSSSGSRNSSTSGEADAVAGEPSEPGSESGSGAG